jgi:hypothetical protein
MSERPSDERLAEWRAMLADGNCHYVKAYVPEYMVNDGIRIITDLLDEVRELRRELAELRQKAAFVDEMLLLRNRDCEECEYHREVHTAWGQTGHMCLIGIDHPCGSVAVIWEDWQEAHRD